MYVLFQIHFIGLFIGVRARNTICFFSYVIFINTSVRNIRTRIFTNAKVKNILSKLSVA
jgi:hypothetical protein